MTYRTLKQAEMLRDHSNHTLRFNRSLHDAGMTGGIDDDAPSGAAIVWGLASFVVTLVLLFVVLR